MLQLVLFVGADGRWLVPMALVQSVQMVSMESELAEMALVQMESVVAGCCGGSQWRRRCCRGSSLRKNILRECHLLDQKAQCQENIGISLAVHSES
jgi:hypothetical protein